ncbi:MAG: HAD family hydrolase [Lachnospiraceae bacterium]|nr:HAD family hydrolase [Lachnospiraceae bacterium]
MKNYIFDLYGTLVDIKTDEAGGRLWRVLADMYNRYGLNVSPKELRTVFLKLEKRARDRTAKALNTETPEIKLEKIFLKIFKKCKKRERAELKEPDEAWADMAANMFRALSIKHIRLYKNVPWMLKKLKDEGNRVYLLSNAQRVFTMPEIEYLGLKDCFDKIYISSDNDLCKPDHRFLEKLITDEGLDRAETVMVGNEPVSDMGMACKCGVKGILFNSGGYREKKIRSEILKYAQRIEIDEKDREAFLRDLRIIKDYRDI